MEDYLDQKKKKYNHQRKRENGKTLSIDNWKINQLEKNLLNSSSVKKILQLDQNY